MKKQYITPATECVEMEAQALCAASDRFTTNGTSGTGSVFDDGATGDALGKGHTSVWGDDDEE